MPAGLLRFARDDDLSPRASSLQRNAWARAFGALPILRVQPLCSHGGATPPRRPALGCSPASLSGPSRLAGLRVTGIEHARRALGAAHGRDDDQADLVDEARAQKGAVGAAAAFEQQALDPELAVEDLEGEAQAQVDLGEPVARVERPAYACCASYGGFEVRRSAEREGGSDTRGNPWTCCPRISLRSIRATL